MKFIVHYVNKCSKHVDIGEPFYVAFLYTLKTNHLEIVNTTLHDFAGQNTIHNHELLGAVFLKCTFKVESQIYVYIVQ